MYVDLGEKIWKGGCLNVDDVEDMKMKYRCVGLRVYLLGMTLLVSDTRVNSGFWIGIVGTVVPTMLLFQTAKLSGKPSRRQGLSLRQKEAVVQRAVMARPLSLVAEGNRGILKRFRSSGEEQTLGRESRYGTGALMLVWC